jgi:hypothetical protein
LRLERVSLLGRQAFAIDDVCTICPSLLTVVHKYSRSTDYKRQFSSLDTQSRHCCERKRAFEDVAVALSIDGRLKGAVSKHELDVLYIKDARKIVIRIV